MFTGLVSRVCIFLSLFLSSCEYLDVRSIVATDTVDNRFEENKRYDKQVPPSLSNPSKFSFLAVADLHYYKENRGDFGGIERLRQQLGFEFVVVAGDVTQSGLEKQFKMVEEDLERLQVPCYFIVGNHDIENNGNRLFGKYFGEYIFSFDVGDTTFIFLDSGNGVLGAKQKHWYEGVLKRSNSNVIVFSHYHIHFTKLLANPVDYPYPEERYYLLNVNDESNVDYYVSGHLHQYNMAKIRGVNYITLDTMQNDNFAMLFTIENKEITNQIVRF